MTGSKKKLVLKKLVLTILSVGGIAGAGHYVVTNTNIGNIVIGKGNVIQQEEKDAPTAPLSEEKDRDEEIKKYSDDVNALIDDEDYENAIEKANEALEEYPNETTLSDLKQRAVTGYEDQILSKANKELKENDYDEALETVNSALDTLANMDESSDKLEKKKEKIEKNMPTKLCELQISESDDAYSKIEDQVMKDTIGENHSPGNLFRIESFRDGGYAKYYLNKQYKKLSFTVAVSEEEPDEKDTATLAIYGDDDQILYSWDDVGRATAPVDVDLVDVENQEWICIRAQSKEYKGVIFLLDNPLLFR